MKKIFFLVIFFYFLTQFQISFLAHFSIKGYFLNIILISLILINFLEKERENYAISSAILAGFFLDIFSGNFFGFWIIIFLMITLFIKYILKQYVRFPVFQ